MDFDEEEHEELEEEIGMHQMQSGNHQTIAGSGRGGGGGDGVSAAASARESAGGGGEGGSGGGGTTTTTHRYRECLKNHAVGIGGHALDGCGEFLAAGEEGTLESLKCAACKCHRNFHRREAEGEGFHHPHPTSHHLHHPHHPGHNQQFSTAYSFRSPHPSGYLHVTPPTRPLALPSTSRDEEDVSNPSSSGGGGGSKKRFRTKFTPDQKEKMLAFAERLGWRIQKEDDALVQQFCAETNVRRQVLKVWMHNNKHTLGKKP